MSEEATRTDSSTDRVSPNDLISGFGRTPVLFWLFVALGAHVLFIGLTSFSYINDTWLDPAGAEQRRLVRRDADKPAFMDDAPVEDSQPAEDTTPKENTDPETDNPPADPGDTTASVAPGENPEDKTAVEERVSDSASAAELDALEKKFFGGEK
jgi:hypothetical protein